VSANVAALLTADTVWNFEYLAECFVTGPPSPECRNQLQSSRVTLDIGLALVRCGLRTRKFDASGGISTTLAREPHELVRLYAGCSP
jgi:hypothetical protein